MFDGKIETGKNQKTKNEMKNYENRREMWCRECFNWNWFFQSKWMIYMFSFVPRFPLKNGKRSAKLENLSCFIVFFSWMPNNKKKENKIKEQIALSWTWNRIPSNYLLYITIIFTKSLLCFTPYSRVKYSIFFFINSKIIPKPTWITFFKVQNNNSKPVWKKKNE